MVVWEHVVQDYTNKWVGRVGRLQVFTISHSLMRNLGNTLYCKLPGTKSPFDCESEDEAKERAEKILQQWLEAAGLKEKS